MSPRPRESSDAELLAAAARVVSRVGPSLTLSDVAAEARVSAATLMQRFGSKRGLLLALFATAPSNVDRELARIRAAAASPMAAVYAVGDCMAAMAVSPRAFANNLSFLQMDLTDPEFHKHALAHSRRMHAGVKALLDEAVTARELQPCDTGRLARAVQGLIGGALLQWAIDREGKPAARLREDLESLLHPRHCPPRDRRRHPRRRLSRG